MVSMRLGGGSWASRGFAAALLLAALVAGPGAAHGAPSAADVDTARALMSQGRAEREKGNHAAALERFQAANKIMTVPTTALEVGQSQADLGQLVEARETWLAAWRLPIEPKEPAAFQKARELAKQLADELEPRIPTVQFHVANAAADGQLKVTLDDVELPPDALLVSRKANPGKHLAVFVDPKHTKKVEFDLVERDAKSVDVDMATGDPTPMAAAPQPNTTTTTSATPPATTPPVTDLERPNPMRAPLMYGGFGLAGAGLIVGGITGVLAFTHGSDAKKLCDGNNCPPAAHDALTSARTSANISNVSFAVAGVGAIVGVVGLLLPVQAAPVATAPAARNKPWASVVVGVGSIGLEGGF